jgi:hypothetical protein
MLEPAFRVGGEVGVVAEDRVGPLFLGELDEEALAADVDAERIERLGPAQGSRFQIGIGERLRPEIDEDVPQQSAAKTARNYQIFQGVSPCFQRLFRCR